MNVGVGRRPEPIFHACEASTGGDWGLTGKGRKTRVVPIMDKTCRHLDQYLNLFHPGRRDVDAAVLFFATRSGRRYPMSQDNSPTCSTNTPQQRAACLEIPEHVHAHQLRHARAMQMLWTGVPLPHIKEFLGHANIVTTNIYASADNQMVRDAIQKAASTTPEPAPIWKGDDALLLQLAGLKSLSRGISTTDGLDLHQRRTLGITKSSG